MRVVLAVVVAAVAAIVAACSSDRPSRPAAAAGDDATAAAPVAGDAAAALPRWSTAPDLGAAIARIVTDDVRAVGFGELHARTDRAAGVRSALSRFTDDALPVLGDRLSDLVLETWLFDRDCGEQAATATTRVEATMRRPASTKSELGVLVERARAAGVQPHVMRLSCDDWTRIAPPPPPGATTAPDVDYEVLLGVITRELGRIAAEAIAYRDGHGATRRLVATYGGALHNDLYPIEGIADWSFAAGLDAAAGGHYLEVDLYVPEYAEVDDLTRGEAWFPLLAEAGADHVLVIERGPRSYVIVLPRSRP